MEEKYPVEACIECTMAVANGEYPESDERFRAILDGEARWWNEGYVVVVSGDDEAHFSWVPCELCACPLGGDRHTIWAVRR